MLRYSETHFEIMQMKPLGDYTQLSRENFSSMLGQSFQCLLGLISITFHRVVLWLSTNPSFLVCYIMLSLCVSGFYAV